MVSGSWEVMTLTIRDSHSMIAMVIDVASQDLIDDVHKVTSCGAFVCRRMPLFFVAALYVNRSARFARSALLPLPSGERETSG